MIRTLFLLYLVLVVSWPSEPVKAQESAISFLKSKHADVIRILNNPSGKGPNDEQYKEKITHALRELLDYEELSQRALDNHWKGLNVEQQTEFTHLLMKLVEKNYQKNLESTQDYHVRYEKSSKSSTYSTVHTIARSKRNRREPEMTIDYKMKRTEKGWKVFDVVTDGVSLVDNYRNQFNRIISRHGWDELIRRMKKRQESGSD